MEFPKRAKQHISETTSYKIFALKVPNRWIIREITERDYGIDCYIEIVNDKLQVTGELISIQLKSREKIEWNVTEPTKWTLSGIDISTTNYWYNFSVPVFIFIVDQTTNEVFFQSVSDYIKLNYLEYQKQKIFSYKIDKNNLLEGEVGLKKFLHQYYKDKSRKEFEKNIVTFFANYKHYVDFFEENTNRDVFLGVETSRVLFARHFYNNIYFLSMYLGLNWNLSPFSDYEKKSQSIFGDDYDLYEQQLDEIIVNLNNMQLPILNLLKELITSAEKDYWLINDVKLFNFVLNATDDGQFPEW